MNCSACGSVLSDGALFCESCGANLRPMSLPSSPALATATSGPSTAVAPAAQSVELPSAAALAQMGSVLLKRLSLGEKFAGAGALAGTLGFFLPWMSGPNLRELGNISTLVGGGGVGTTSYSAFDLTKIWGGTYLLLGAAIASGVLFFVSRRAPFSRKLLISGFQVMIGTLVGPAAVFALLFVPLMQSVAGLGLWLTGLGFCSIMAGGLVTIGQIGKMVR